MVLTPFCHMLEKLPHEESAQGPGRRKDGPLFPALTRSLMYIYSHTQMYVLTPYSLRLCVTMCSWSLFLKWGKKIHFIGMKWCRSCGNWAVGKSPSPSHFQNAAESKLTELSSLVCANKQECWKAAL